MKPTLKGSYKTIKTKLLPLKIINQKKNNLDIKKKLNFLIKNLQNFFSISIFNPIPFPYQNRNKWLAHFPKFIFRWFLL